MHPQPERDSPPAGFCPDGAAAFEQTPHLYDAFYDAAGKQYADEAALVIAQARARVPHARGLLDVACGTGRHLEHFRKEFECVGVDLDDRLLELARARCPEVRFVQGDMLDFELGERFDVVTCLFSSIAYMRTPDRLERAIATIARHVAPGGVLLLEPSFKPDRWQVDHVGALFVDRPELKAARIGHSAREGDVAIVTLHYLIGSPEGVSYLEERHAFGLFSDPQYSRAFERAGLSFEVDEEGPYGRGMLIGQPRSATEVVA